MSSVAFVAMLVVHLAFWVVQIMKNTMLGASECEISVLACGSGALETLLNIVEETGDISGFGGLVSFMLSATGAFFSACFKIAFLDYEWLAGGGDVVGMAVSVIKMIMGAVFIAALGKVVVGAVTGRLPFG